MTSLISSLSRLVYITVAYLIACWSLTCLCSGPFIPFNQGLLLVLAMMTVKDRPFVSEKQCQQPDKSFEKQQPLGVATETESLRSSSSKVQTSNHDLSVPLLVSSTSDEDSQTICSHGEANNDAISSTENQADTTQQYSIFQALKVSLFEYYMTISSYGSIVC